MHRNLLFNGCSFTEGGELEGPNKNIEHLRTHRFSHLVANYFGMTYDNISKSGSSNDVIVEKTIEWFEEGNSCDIAVIQFTEKSRTIWYDDETKKSYNLIINVEKENTQNYKFISAHKFYYKTFYSNLLADQNFYKNLFILENYFHTKNIQYILLRLDNLNSLKNENILHGWARYSKYKNFIYILTLLEEEKNKNYCPNLFKQFPKDRRYSFLKGLHPNEIGHKKISEAIIDKINKLK